MPRKRLVSPGLRFKVALCLVGVLVVGGWPVGAGVGAGAGAEERNGRPLDPEDGVWFEEVVTHPISDWQGNDRVSSLDEYIVLRNFGDASVDVTGWVLHMIDGTDEESVLDGVLGPGEAFVLLNPPGRINNDVRLLLVDEAGEPVDDVTLGQAGVPEGRGEGVLDEAVHLAGPWAGLQGPGTGGRGLGPFFVSHIAAATVIDEALAFQDAWMAPEPGALAVKIYKAPGFFAGDWDLQLAGEAVSLVLVNETTGVWQSDPVSVAEVAHMQVVSSDYVLDAFPAGQQLRVRLDSEPPYFEDGADSGEPSVGIKAVADAERRIHWFPQLIAGPSGIVSVTVETTGGTGLPGCLPLDASGPDCVVPVADDVVVVVVRDGAGRVTVKSLPVEFWEGAPEVPGFHFLQGPPPRLAWAHGDRVLKQVVVGSAQDVTGAWPVREVTLAGNATGFVDDAWVPGEPRAYRLIVTDLADNTATGPWVALDPEDVPVQAEMQLPQDLSSLALQGEAEVKVLFDRPLEKAPKFALQMQTPQPLYQEIEGEPVAGQDAYSYMVKLPGPVKEAIARADLVGGRGVDQAPIDPVAQNVTWDHEPPRLAFAGVEPRWVQGTRHVLTVSATDGIDDEPSVMISQVPEHASVEEFGASARVTLQGQGLLQVEGHAEDASGNRASFVLEVGLDATPPEVHGLQAPSIWSSDAPLGFQVADDASGVNVSSLQAWVRNESVLFESTVELDEDGWVQVRPVNITQANGPFEVYVAVADRAGNGVEGFLSDRLVPVAMTDPDNGSVSVHPLEDQGPGAGAPLFLGPPWFQEDGTQEGQVMATGAEGSNEGAPSSPWEGFSWDDVEQEEESRSLGWYLLGLVGFLGLGTAVHQVGRHRKKAQQKDPGVKGDAGPKPANKPQDDGGDRAEDAVKGAAAMDRYADAEGAAPRPIEESPVVVVAASTQPDDESSEADIVRADTGPEELPAGTSPFVDTDQTASFDPLWDVDCDRDPDEGEGSAGWAHVVVDCPPAVEA